MKAASLAFMVSWSPGLKGLGKWWRMIELARARAEALELPSASLSPLSSHWLSPITSHSAGPAQILLRLPVTRERWRAPRATV